MTGEAKLTWQTLFPEGRLIFYEGDDPTGFCEEILKNFGFDPSKSDDWDDMQCFHCPPEYLDAIYGNDRYSLGS